MSIFVNYNKNSKMTVEFDLNNNGDVNMAISKLYDLIEETIDGELDKFKNTFFEIFDDETTSDGRIYINTNTDEDDVLPIVKRVLKQFPMVKVTIEDTPSLILGYYFYGFTIEVKDEDVKYWEECEKEEQDIRDMAQFEIVEYTSIFGEYKEDVLDKDELRYYTCEGMYY